MAFVKKNIIALILLVVALAAMVVPFFPMSGMFESLQTEVDARAKKSAEAQAILNKNRSLPDIDLVGSSSPKPLTAFPAPNLTKMVKTYMGQLISQSLGVLKTAVKINEKECFIRPMPTGLSEEAEDNLLLTPSDRLAQLLLLTPESLPIIKPNADNIFKKALQPEYDRILSHVLFSGHPPTEADLKIESEKVVVKHQPDLIKGGAGEPAINQILVDTAIAEEIKDLPNKLRTEAAAKCRIYIDADVLGAPKEIITPATSPNATQIWFAQVQLWVHEDVCRAIAEANGAASNVQNAPVKRLVSFVIPNLSSMYVVDPSIATAAQAGTVSTGGTGAGPFLTPIVGPAKRNFAVSPTGRSSNDTYDVISFTLSLHVDQTEIPRIVKALAHNRFITVLGMNITRHDAKEFQDLGYMYGGGPIAEVTMDCEMLLMREWTVPWMPDEVKGSLLGRDPNTTKPIEYPFQLRKKP